MTYPASCEVSLDVTYLPVQADAGGWASGVRAEIETAVAKAVAADPWLTAYPPAFAWDTELPPAEVDGAHPLVASLLATATSLGRSPRILGEPSWTDAATLTRLADTPAVCLGPTATRPDGSPTLHTIDEYIEVSDLVATAKTLALTALAMTAPAAS